MNIAVRRIALLPFLAVALACPGDKTKGTAQLPVDTAKPDTSKALATTDTSTTDLRKVKTNLPKPAPDTFHQQKLTSPGGAGVGSNGRTSFAEAPAPLIDAVEREQSATRFCYTEFGQKADPSLRGNVAMLVTIGGSGVTDATVADSKWGGNAAAGRAVNRCLDQKAKQAWNVAPGAVRPGRYVVQLSFTGAR